MPGKDFTLLFLVLIFGKVSASNAFSACYTRQHSIKQLQADKSTHTWKKTLQTPADTHQAGRTFLWHQSLSQRMFLDTELGWFQRVPQL